MGGAGRRSSLRPQSSITLLVQKGIENYSADLDGKSNVNVQRGKEQLLRRRDLLRSALKFGHVGLELSLKETFATAMCKNDV